jgi:riboflavin kinase / FMN adenylyltransferase
MELVTRVLICQRLEELPALGQDLHLAIGVFDGVHLGHQAVIAAAVRAAAEHGGLAGLLTFDPHPIRVIAPGKAPTSLLETLDHKARVVGGLGVELLIPLHFDAAMAAMAAVEFVERLTAAPVRTIAVGEDWRFGHHRAGDVNLLRNEAETRGFRLEAVPPVMFEGDRISSTRIRQAIHDGNLDEAARMLGRRYSVSGPVVKGAQLGRQLGFPTANVDTGNLQLPPDGVWAVRVIDAANRQWDGVANLGMRPTVGGTKRLLEVHLFGFSGEIYGENLEVRFENHLRPEMKFPSLELLKERISIDAQAARESLLDSGKCS